MKQWDTRTAMNTEVDGKAQKYFSPADIDHIGKLILQGIIETEIKSLMQAYTEFYLNSTYTIQNIH
jgi:hypothetical protein